MQLPLQGRDLTLTQSCNPVAQVREADADDELQAAAWLRALSFGRYPEERKFAAEVCGLQPCCCPVMQSCCCCWLWAVAAQVGRAGIC